MKEVKITKHWSNKTYNVDLISWQKNGEGVSFGRAFDVSKKEAEKVAKYNLDNKYPQYFGEDKNFQDKYFINEIDKDVYFWCEHENEIPIRFDKSGNIKTERKKQ